MFNEPLVLPELVEETLDSAGVQAVGETLDIRLSALACTGTYERDEVTLSYLSLVESTFLHHPASWLEHSGYLPPILDHVLPLYPATRACESFDERAIEHVRHWADASADYDQLVGAVLNALSGRASAVRVKGGRIVFFVREERLKTEARHHWFSHRFYAWNDATQRGMPRPDDTESIPKLDHFVKTEGLSHHDGVDFCRIPKDEWYLEHCRRAVDAHVEKLFEHVENAESWAGLTMPELLARVRPITMRAAKRHLVQRAAQRILACSHGEPRVLGSAVETCEFGAIVRDVADSAGCAEADASRFVRDLVRPPRGEERCEITAHPLIRLFGERVAVLPSVVWYGNWPLHLEQAAAKAPGGSQMGQVRERRHLRMIEGWLRAAGYDHVAKGIDLEEAAGRKLTDLDVVAVSRNLQDVLVLQLKSFVTPTNLQTVSKAEENVRKAVAQCDVGAANLPVVKRAIEARLGIGLAKHWRLHQLIVVEAHPGLSEPHPDYPVVTLEWLRNELPRYGACPATLWRAGRDLPDAAGFFDSLRPSFAVYGSRNSPVCAEREEFAVFQYGSGRVSRQGADFIVE